MRIEAGLSQEALADLAGVHRTFIGLVEQHRRNPRVDSVNRVLQALNASWTELGGRLDAELTAFPRTRDSGASAHNSAPIKGRKKPGN